MPGSLFDKVVGVHIVGAHNKAKTIAAKRKDNSSQRKSTIPRKMSTGMLRNKAEPDADWRRRAGD